MALSRTARILVAVLLLAAAAFFWVNFFTQGRLLADDGGAGDPSAAAPPTTPTPVPAAEAEGDGELAGAVAPDPESTGGVTAATDTASAAADATPADAVTVAPVVVVDAPVSLSRAVVVADLPFLVTSPAQAPVETAAVDEAEAEAGRSVTATRATVNPFSPVVVRQAAAPVRDVPAAPVVTEVAVPAAPTVLATAAPTPRVATPTPQVVAPASAPVRDLPRALPTGTLLGATPDLLRTPNAPVERVDVSRVAAVRVPEPEVAPPVEAVAVPNVTTAIARPEPEVLRTPPHQATTTTEVAAAARAPQAALFAGTNPLDRFLRDNGYTFTGSALGPVSVGVFRSTRTPTPIVVALGQTLPDSEIVLTDLRGQQAELTLGDTSRILVLDLRR
jgi:hypothetical protein